MHKKKRQWLFYVALSVVKSYYYYNYCNYYCCYHYYYCYYDYSFPSANQCSCVAFAAPSSDKIPQPACTQCEPTDAVFRASLCVNLAFRSRRGDGSSCLKATTLFFWNLQNLFAPDWFAQGLGLKCKMIRETMHTLDPEFNTRLCRPNFSRKVFLNNRMHPLQLLTLVEWDQRAL